jgi:hypothetical protein
MTADSTIPDSTRATASQATTAGDSKLDPRVSEILDSRPAGVSTALLESRAWRGDTDRRPASTGFSRLDPRPSEQRRRPYATTLPTATTGSARYRETRPRSERGLTDGALAGRAMTLPEREPDTEYGAQHRPIGKATH